MVINTNLTGIQVGVDLGKGAPTIGGMKDIPIPTQAPKALKQSDIVRAFGDLMADAQKGPVDYAKIEEFYPEFRGKTQSLKDLNADLDIQGLSIDQIKQGYPEFFEGYEDDITDTSKKLTWGNFKRYLKDSGQQVLAPSVGLLQGLAEAAAPVVNVLEKGQEALFGLEATDVTDQPEQTARAVLGDYYDTFGREAANLVGQTLPTIAATAPLSAFIPGITAGPGATLGQKAVATAARTAFGAGEGLLGDIMYNIINKDEDDNYYGTAVGAGLAAASPLLPTPIKLLNRVFARGINSIRGMFTPATMTAADYVAQQIKKTGAKNPTDYVINQLKNKGLEVTPQSVEEEAKNVYNQYANEFYQNIYSKGKFYDGKGNIINPEDIEVSKEIRDKIGSALKFRQKDLKFGKTPDELSSDVANATKALYLNRDNLMADGDFVEGLFDDSGKLLDLNDVDIVKNLGQNFRKTMRDVWDGVIEATDEATRQGYKGDLTPAIQYLNNSLDDGVIGNKILSLMPNGDKAQRYMLQLIKEFGDGQVSIDKLQQISQTLNAVAYKGDKSDAIKVIAEDINRIIRPILHDVTGQMLDGLGLSNMKKIYGSLRNSVELIDNIGRYASTKSPRSFGETIGEIVGAGDIARGIANIGAGNLGGLFDLSSGFFTKYLARKLVGQSDRIKIFSDVFKDIGKSVGDAKIPGGYGRDLVRSRIKPTVKIDQTPKLGEIEGARPTITEEGVVEQSIVQTPTKKGGTFGMSETTDVTKPGAIKKQEPLKSMDFSKPGSFDVFRNPKSNFMITTTYNPMGQSVDNEINKKNLSLLENFLTINNIDYKKQIGYYGDIPEESLLINIENSSQRKQIDRFVEDVAPQAENILIKNGKAYRYNPRAKGEAFVTDLTKYDENLEQPMAEMFFSEIDGRKYRLPLYDDTYENPIDKKQFLDVYNN